MDGKDLAYCRGCDYLGRTGTEMTCEYGQITGSLRIKATDAPPGIGCPLHTKPEKATSAATVGTKQKKKAPDTAPIDELRALQLYNDGLDDIAMADALGVTAKRVQNWRLRMHLKRPNAGQKKKIEKEKKSSVSQENEQADRGSAEACCENAAGEQETAAIPQQEETAASCRQVSEPLGTREISAETVETQEAAASETKPERSEAIRVREMFALLEKLVQAGLGDAPTQIDGTYIKDFYAVSILRTKDGISVDLTTMK